MSNNLPKGWLQRQFKENDRKVRALKSIGLEILTVEPGFMTPKKLESLRKKKRGKR